MTDTNLFPEISDPVKRAFLIAYTESGSIAEASKLAGNERTTVWYWRRDDPQFLEAFKVSEQIYSSGYLNELQQELKKRATDYKAPMSTVALFFALKAEAPEKYRDNQSVIIDQRQLNITRVEIVKPEIRELEYKEVENAIQGQDEATGSNQEGSAEA